MNEITMRVALTDAIHFWEWRRLVYNGALGLIVSINFFLGYPESLKRLTVDLLQGIFILAVLANVAYCAAYIADIPAQMSGVRDLWLKYRWVLFAIGLTFAGIITRFFSLGLFHASN